MLSVVAPAVSVLCRFALCDPAHGDVDVRSRVALGVAWSQLIVERRRVRVRREHVERRRRRHDHV